VRQWSSVANAGAPPQMRADFEHDGDDGSRTVIRVVGGAPIDPR
jgi:hypothetical protein